MIEIKNMRLGVGENAEALTGKAAKILKISPARITEMRLVKRSLDARKKGDIHYVCTAAFSVGGDEKKLIAAAGSKDAAASVR